MQKLADPRGFVDELGGLHDAYIETVDISTGDGTLSFGIDDLNAPSRHWGKADEPRERPATILFTGVRDLKLALNVRYEKFDGVCISHLAVTPHGHNYRLEIALSAGGIPSVAEKWWMTAMFDAMYLEEIKQ